MPTAQAQAPSRLLTDLLARFRSVRQSTVDFVAPLSPEDLMVQSCPESSPGKWHLAHTSWFFETFVLTPYLPGYAPFHPSFHWLFNSYYNSLGEMPEKKLRASFSRPPLDRILAYRGHVDAGIAELLASELSAETEDDALRRIVLGLQHEQQHLELLVTDIKHALFTNPLHPAYREEFPRLQTGKTACPLSFAGFQGGLVEIGASPDPVDPLAFAFDNETPRHTVFLQPYSVADRPVTCAEYLAFIESNGYTRPELWLAEGWATMRAEGWQAPLYWKRDDQVAAGWSVYTLGGFVPLESLLQTPVCHLSFFEAEAFARWFALEEPGCRLPTEFEWEHGASSLSTLPGGAVRNAAAITYATPPERSGVIVGVPVNMLEAGRLHPAPAHPLSGLQGMYGDVWQWTASPYTGYPGYRPLPGALGEYNGKFMSSQVILRGGSCVTPATHIRATYRNFFAPGTRWQFSGLRLAKDGA